MVKVYDLNGQAIGEMQLPKVFKTEYRPDLIQRAVLAIQSSRRQPYGTNWFSGKKSSAHYHGVGRGYGAMKNREMARMKRIHGKGPPGLLMRARFVPQAVGGRETHPPKAEKIWKLKINKTEKILALKSAIAASIIFDLVSKRHKVSEMNLPIILSDRVEEIKKTKELEKVMENLKLSSDLERAKHRKVRAGKGKVRGRRYKNKKSFLMVVSEDKGVMNSAKNLAGVDICNVRNLNVELLAPGTQPGRLVVWTEGAVKKLSEIYG